ncbi:hypothetical protein F4779DRAFT_313356 [Xylariaceae sp. FL0662B]|nr:hypothetical protein F4779DRAFT_313356 [Xylariaceae sp. FL0662B]
MTKQWELHEATIKTLYADHTLSVVRKIMIEKHGFKASTRAYRGRLIRWGVRKYNCKKRHDRASSLSSNDGCSSEPDPVSPAVSRDDFESMPTAAQRAETRRVSDSALAMLGRIGRQYDQVNGGPSQAYTDHPQL